MPRRARSIVGGLVYHVLNRSNARLPLFEKDGDYEAFERVLEQARQREPLRILGHCVMPNHWHRDLHGGASYERTFYLREPRTNASTLRYKAAISSTDKPR